MPTEVEQTTPTKNEQIKLTLANTKARHEKMLCRVYEVKIISGKLSSEKKAHLNALFLEAKWLRNSELAKGDLSLLDDKTTVATVKVGKVFEERKLTHLSSQMRQSVIEQIKKDASSLSELKKHGYAVGKLKFKSFCNCVPLKQYGNTYRIDFEKNLVFIQGYKKPFKVRGLKQIPADAEIANAKLIRKPSGYYFHITTYTKPQPSIETGNKCGIDFGISKSMTFDNGDTENICIPETKGVKLASRRMNKAFHHNGEEKSKNHFKRVQQLRRAYEKQNNIKHDLANKIVHNLMHGYDFIAIQDEMIAGWHHGLFGKQVQHSAMGTIKAKLKNSSKTFVVPRSFPSTQKCPICGKNTKHTLDQRTYQCAYCGYTHPSRDAKAAGMILMEALGCVYSELSCFSGAEN